LIASNLAIALARYQGKKVCLFDLDINGIGGMARIIDVLPQRSIVDLIASIKLNQGSQINKEDFLIKTKWGIDFLPALVNPQQSPHLEADKLDSVFDILDTDYDYIVVDAGNSFNDVLVSGLNKAHIVFLVVTPDILSIYQIKWALDILQSMHIPLNMVRTILNRAESDYSISWQEVRTSIPVDIIAQIPSDGRLLGRTVNRGIPFVIDSPKSKISRSIINLSKTLVTDEELFIQRQKIDNILLKDFVLERPSEFLKEQVSVETSTGYRESKLENDPLIQLKRRIHNRLLDELNLKRLDAGTFRDKMKAQELRNRAEIMITNFLAEDTGLVTSHDLRKSLTKDILDDALGLGPLEDLLVDPAITDIMVNNKDEVYIEKNGKLEITKKKFISNEQVRMVIERIIAPLGRRIDESVPMVDARLEDGSRVNAIIPPLSLTGPTLTIRKFRKEKFKIEDLINFNSLNQNMAEFIKAAVVCRKNIIVSGGTGSGKTTMLNVLSGFIPGKERIITIEDAAELKLNQEHWVRLESRPPNMEGKGAIAVRDIFRNTLRMRPDRIIIGECRGLETLDMLQAMNTGHDGSMTTVHANSTQDVLTRLDSMILISGIELPVRAIREMVASAINLIIQTARLSDGTRKVIQITELLGMKDDIHINTQDIFIFKQSGLDSKGNIIGEFKSTGYLPTFLEEIQLKGISLSDGIFKVS